MRKLAFTLIAALLCMNMLCSCYYPDTESWVDKTDDGDGKKPAVDIMAGEIIPEGNTAIIMDDVKGKSDPEAEAMRKDILEAKDELEIKGKTYYVSAKNGNDENNGTSPETAWQTLDALATNAWQFTPGDAVLLERGSIFRPTSQVFCKEGVTYGAYGEGNKPVIYGSVENYAKPGYWEPSSKKNVWKLDLPLEDAGIIVFNHGEAVGVKQGGLMSVTKNFDFYHNTADNILYLYLDTGRPNQVYDDIEIGVKRAIFTLNTGIDDITIDNICMKYTGTFGVQAIGFHDNIKVTNCEIGWIGGSYQTEGLTGRYGNGIQFWDDASNTIVDKCWIYQVYDTGITWQGSYYANYDNVQFTNNLIEYCTMSIEFWDQAVPLNASKPQGEIKNILISGNICRFAGYGWGKQRYNPSQTAHIQGSSEYRYDVDSLEISNNIFDKTTHSIIYWGPLNGDAKYKDNDIVVKNNTYYQGKSLADGIMSLPGYGWQKAANASELNAAIKVIDKSPKAIEWVD
ncbi:MAG: hypothetical protein J6B93_03325 [Clostridia bacterium]|nr:hypothetical protein [Clostridia bacterium]